MRSLRSEFASLMAVAAVPCAIALVFPYGALSFRATREVPESVASAAFVRLSPEEERSALLAAKSSWQGESSSVRHLRADLSFGDLPEEPPLRVLVAGRREVRQPGPVDCGFAPFVPSRAAPAPASLPVSGRPEVKPAFSREEMLGIE